MGAFETKLMSQAKKKNFIPLYTHILRIRAMKKELCIFFIYVVPFYSCKVWNMGIHKKYFLVYLYFKFVAICKKGIMCLFIHIILMYTHILTIKRNYVNNETYISPFLINYDNWDT